MNGNSKKLNMKSSLHEHIKHEMLHIWCNSNPLDRKIHTYILGHVYGYVYICVYVYMHPFYICVNIGMYIIYHIHIIYQILLCRYGKYIFLYINNYIIPDYMIYITYNPCIHIYMQKCTNSIFFMFSCLYTHTYILFPFNFP